MRVTIPVIYFESIVHSGTWTKKTPALCRSQSVDKVNTLSDCEKHRKARKRTCKKGSLLKVSDRILQVKLTMEAKKFFDLLIIKEFFAFAGFVIGLPPCMQMQGRFRKRMPGVPSESPDPHGRLRSVCYSVYRNEKSCLIPQTAFSGP